MTTSDPAPAGDDGTDGGQRADGSRRAGPVVQIDVPTRDDNFVRGVSESIGGPLGVHADPPWSPLLDVVRIVIALTCLTFTLHWAEKSDLQRRQLGQKLSEYRHACYTDVVALYNSEGLSDGKVPYVPSPVEYPVLTGAFMGLIGLPVHAYVDANPGTNPYKLYYNVNALALGAVAVASVIALLPTPATTTLGCRDVRGVAGVAPDRDRELGSPGGRFRGLRLLAWSRRRPTLAAVLISSRYVGETVAGVPAHPDAVAGLAFPTTRGCHLHRRRRRARLGCGQPAVLLPVSAQLESVLPAQRHARGRLGHVSGTSARHVPHDRTGTASPGSLDSEPHQRRERIVATCSSVWPTSRSRSVVHTRPVVRAGPARLPDRGGLPDLLEGVVPAVRAVAAAAGRVGPAALGSVRRVAARRDLLLLRVRRRADARVRQADLPGGCVHPRRVAAADHGVRDVRLRRARHHAARTRCRPADLRRRSGRWSVQRRAGS